MSQYVLRGGSDGKKRLAILARAFANTTARLLKEAGLGPGMTCLDLGCGGGDVTLELARAVGPEGRVVGIDADPVTIELDRQDAARLGLDNVEFRPLDIKDWRDDARYDLIYCRFVLTHLSDPASIVRRMRSAVRPGGVVVLEDIDIQGHFCYPVCHAFDEYVRLYIEVVRRRGADPFIGLKLHSLLLDTGWQAPSLSLVQPAYFSGECKQIPLLSLMYIRESVLVEGLAAPAEFDQIVNELATYTDDPRSTIGYPRVFQTWARQE